MQPYFLPYIGYWQLLAATDVFVIYDDVKFTKAGWIHRNRMLVNCRPEWFTVPLEAGPDAAMIRDRHISSSFASRERDATLRRFEAAYRRAPFVEEGLELVRRCLTTETRSLFEFIAQSISLVADHLGITTPRLISSSLAVDPSLSGQARVIATCLEVGATTYRNPPGGRPLYAPEAFERAGIELQFQSVNEIAYPQGCTEFVAKLSIIDVIMNVAKPERTAMLHSVSWGP